MERDHLWDGGADRGGGAGGGRGDPGRGGRLCDDRRGAGAIEAIEANGGIGKAKIVILTDVRTVWEDAPKVFGPQKGADEAMIERLEQRLDELAQQFPRTRAACR